MEGRREGVSAAAAFQFPVFCPSSGRLSPMRAGVVELQPRALRVLLLHPPEAVPGWNPALPGLVRRVPLPSLNPGAHPCWGQQGASHTSPWSLGSCPDTCLGSSRPSKSPSRRGDSNKSPSQRGDTSRACGSPWLEAGCGTAARRLYLVKVTFPSWAALTRCWGGEASPAMAGTALDWGFLLSGHPGASAGRHTESCPEQLSEVR